MLLCVGCFDLGRAQRRGKFRMQAASFKILTMRCMSALARTCVFVRTTHSARARGKHFRTEVANMLLVNIRK